MCDESEGSEIAAAEAQPHDDQSESHHRTLNVPRCAVTQDAGWMDIDTDRAAGHTAAQIRLEVSSKVQCRVSVTQST